MAFNGILKKKKITSPIKIPSPNSFSDLFGSRLVISVRCFWTRLWDAAGLAKVGSEEEGWGCPCEGGVGLGVEHHLEHTGSNGNAWHPPTPAHAHTTFQITNGASLGRITPILTLSSSFLLLSLPLSGILCDYFKASFLLSDTYASVWFFGCRPGVWSTQFLAVLIL